MSADSVLVEIVRALDEGRLTSLSDVNEWALARVTQVEHQEQAGFLCRVRAGQGSGFTFVVPTVAGMGQCYPFGESVVERARALWDKLQNEEGDSSYTIEMNDEDFVSAILLSPS